MRGRCRVREASLGRTDQPVGGWLGAPGVGGWTEIEDMLNVEALIMKRAE